MRPHCVQSADAPVVSDCQFLVCDQYVGMPGSDPNTPRSRRTVREFLCLDSKGQGIALLGLTGLIVESWLLLLSKLLSVPNISSMRGLRMYMRAHDTIMPIAIIHIDSGGNVHGQEDSSTSKSASLCEWRFDGKDGWVGGMSPQDRYTWS